jgi:hypothetical protein
MRDRGTGASISRMARESRWHHLFLLLSPLGKEFSYVQPQMYLSFLW